MTLSTLNRINEWLRFEAHIFLVYNLVKGKRCVEMVHILFQLKKGFEKQRDSKFGWNCGGYISEFWQNLNDV